MAEIRGTEGADTLNGTADLGGDNIFALGGDDLINSSPSADTIDGGSGTDTVSYDNNSLFGGPAPSASVLFVRYFPLENRVEKQADVGRRLTLSDRLVSVEKVIGKNNGSSVELNGVAAGSSAIYDLLSKTLTLTGAGTQTYGIDKFSNFSGTGNADRFIGDANSNRFIGFGGNDTFISSGGDDIFVAGDGADTADYSGVGQALTLRNTLPSTATGNFIFEVDKGNGTDRLTADIETVIAPAGRGNSLVYTERTGSGLNADLSQDQVNGYTIRNLVHVTGGSINDRIIGNSRNNRLRGGGGNDTISGGDGDDRLIGTDPTSKGVGELDTLTGGSGSDTFVLGISSGSYYKGNGSSDFVTITDFGAGDRLQLGQNETYSVQFNGDRLDLFTVTNGVSDQIAAISISQLQGQAKGVLTALQGQLFSANALNQSIVGNADVSPLV
jgi:Ca2+-binding RTX toxin-like protein